MHRRRQEEKRVEELFQYHRKNIMSKYALFDFDDSVDNLSAVSEKYAPLVPETADFKQKLA
jgi:hypothetical protein